MNPSMTWLQSFISARRHGKRAIAQKVLESVSLFTSGELVDKVKYLMTTRSCVHRKYISGVAAPLDLQVGALGRLLCGLNIYKFPLCDFLMFKAQSSTGVRAHLDLWHTHSTHRNSLIGRSCPSGGSDLSLPPEIICSISQAVFEDPVTASDNFAYRAALH